MKNSKAPKQGEKLMQIGKTAQKAGVSRQSLQYYLMVGLLEPTDTTPSGRRMFDHAAVERIQLIHKLNQSGYTLRAIRELFIEREKIKRGSGK
ncbi:MAG: MerR family transcriptional regulator [Planctomycetota bacterium]